MAGTLARRQLIRWLSMNDCSFQEKAGTNMHCYPRRRDSKKMYLTLY